MLRPSLKAAGAPAGKAGRHGHFRGTETSERLNLFSTLNKLYSAPVNIALRSGLDNVAYIHYTYYVATGGFMTKHLTQHGNSAALVIDKPILALLNITMTTPLEISTDGRSLVISPAIEKSRQKKFKAAMDSVNTLHGKTLRKLAE